MTGAGGDRRAVMENTSLDILAAQINRHFEFLAHVGPHYDDHRISVGLLLIAARDSIENGKWHDWLKGNIKRSIRDCQKAMALANAPNPRKKLEASPNWWTPLLSSEGSGKV